jgi:hypothetical protein
VRRKPAAVAGVDGALAQRRRGDHGSEPAEWIRVLQAQDALWEQARTRARRQHHRSTADGDGAAIRLAQDYLRAPRAGHVCPAWLTVHGHCLTAQLDRATTRAERAQPLFHQQLLRKHVVPLPPRQRRVVEH